MDVRIQKRTWADRHPIRSAALYTFLTILFLLFIATSGIAFITKLSSILENTKPEQQDTSSTQVFLPTPSLDAMPTITNQASMTINGSSESGATVRIFFNGKSNDVLVNSGGKFTFDVTLSDGENTVKAVTTDNSGHLSHESDVYTVTLDTQAPVLTVDSPNDGQQLNGKKNQQITVSGSVNEAATVTVNDHIAIVNTTGNFSDTLNLNEGENDISIKATDKAGNQVEVKRVVTYSP